jgi:pyruvate kinase
MMSGEGRFRSTKIVATLGPASAEPPVLRELLQAGVDVVRINSSHGDPGEWSEWIQRVRRLAAELERPVGVLVDLQGPRIRVGSLKEPIALEPGAEVVFAPEHEARAGEIPTTYAALARDVMQGSTILLDDGLLSVEVTAVVGSRVTAVVRQGGQLGSHKGMNLPGTKVSAPTLTDADRRHLAVAVERDVDFIGISFVRTAEDVVAVRDLVPEHLRLVAKIEMAAAVDDLPRILDVSDAVMVARGDLGVELPFEEVPLVQKRLIAQANRHARPVITATQMLESMVQNARPTRAEASDVANAILDGTDAVMLSAETAVGKYPVRAVEAMVRIITEVERSMSGDRAGRRRRPHGRDATPPLVEDAIAYATAVASEMLQVPLIVCYTTSGFTARKIAAHRPSVPIVGLSTVEHTVRSLTLVWGVAPMLVQHAPTYETMLSEARDRLLALGVVEAGDSIAVTAGVPLHVPGTTNLLKVETI